MALRYFRYYLIINNELDSTECFNTTDEAREKANFYSKEIGIRNIHIVCLVDTINSSKKPKSNIPNQNTDEEYEEDPYLTGILNRNKNNT